METFPRWESPLLHFFRPFGLCKFWRQCEFGLPKKIGELNTFKELLFEQELLTIPSPTNKITFLAWFVFSFIDNRAFKSFCPYSRQYCWSIQENFFKEEIANLIKDVSLPSVKDLGLMEGGNPWANDTTIPNINRKVKDCNVSMMLPYSSHTTYVAGKNWKSVSLHHKML